MDDAGLLEAQAWLTPEVTKFDSLDVTFDGPPVDLTPPVTLDFEYGGGHGGDLVLTRLTVGPESTRIERVAWQGPTNSTWKIARGAERAEIATPTLKPLLDCVRALSRAKVTIRDGEHAGSSSADFLVLVRVCADAPATDAEWEFAGYSGGETCVRYAAVDAVVTKAAATLDALSWTPVPRAAYRKTHFSEAFVRNRHLYAEKYHWWVMERSVEALGWFGDRGTIETLAWIRDNVTDLNQRQRAKIDCVLGQSATYLAGPPRDVPGE